MSLYNIGDTLIVSFQVFVLNFKYYTCLGVISLLRDAIYQNCLLELQKHESVIDIIIYAFGNCDEKLQPNKSITLILGA